MGKARLWAFGLDPAGDGRPPAEAGGGKSLMSKTLSLERRRLLARLSVPKLRRREGLFLVEGVRGVREVLRAPRPPRIRFGVVSPRVGTTEDGIEVWEKLRRAGIPLCEVPDPEMERIAPTERPQGVLLVLEEPRWSWEVLGGIPYPRLLVLDGLQDPGNVGALLRTAWAFGLHAVVALEGTADPWSPKATRAAAGAMVHLPVLGASWERAAEYLEERGIPLWAAEAGGEPVAGVNPGASWALALGNEGAGLRPGVLGRAVGSVAVPMEAGVDSLNTASAGAVLLYAMVFGNRSEGRT